MFDYYSERRFTDSHCAECRIFYRDEWRYDECHYKGCCYVKCHYAKCRHGECCGTFHDAVRRTFETSLKHVDINKRKFNLSPERSLTS
jgi:hypothetical protein